MKLNYFAVLLLHAVALAPLPAAQRAVIVTIEDYTPTLPREKNLIGTHVDGEEIKKLLVSDLGFTASDIVELRDRAATKAAVLNALKQAAGQTTSTDSFVFFYSGHGTQFPDQNGDEADGKDEAIVTYDIKGDDPKTWLTDDLIQDAMKQFKSKKLLLIFDSCNSGTMSKGFSSAGMVKAVDFGYGAVPGVKALKAAGASPSQIEAAGQIVLSASSSAELSRMRRDGPGSVFTRLLVDAAKGHLDDPLADVMKGLVPQVVERVRRDETGDASTKPEDKDQTPEGEGDLRVSLRTLLASSGSLGTPPPSVLSMPTQFGITISPDKKAYQLEELLKIQVTSEQDGYLQLYCLNGKGQLTLLFPNKFAPDARISRQTPMDVPAQNASFDLVIDGQPGKELLIAVVTSNPPRFDLSKVNDFIQLSEELPLSSVFHEGDTGRASTGYDILPKP